TVPTISVPTLATKTRERRMAFRTPFSDVFEDQGPRPCKLVRCSATARCKPASEAASSGLAGRRLKIADDDISWQMTGSSVPGHRPDRATGLLHRRRLVLRHRIRRLLRLLFRKLLRFFGSLPLPLRFRLSGDKISLSLRFCGIARSLVVLFPGF